ncbi:MAG: hypothetical protein P4M11_03325, partial [Candidatus Pacebacteria bacterium]|nr:hypothetical protein [Candidatus Paceibacterota bacterium]
MREEAGKFGREQQLYFSSTTRLRDILEKRNVGCGSSSGVSKELAQLRADIGRLSDRVKKRSQENSTTKCEIEEEKRRILELADIVKNMKNEILENKKLCSKARKGLVVGDNQIQQLKQKCDKYVFRFMFTPLDRRKDWKSSMWRPTRPSNVPYYVLFDSLSLSSSYTHFRFESSHVVIFASVA